MRDVHLSEPLQCGPQRLDLADLRILLTQLAESLLCPEPFCGDLGRVVVNLSVAFTAVPQKGFCWLVKNLSRSWKDTITSTS